LVDMPSGKLTMHTPASDSGVTYSIGCPS
jgi:hypothetical protein